MSEVSYHAKWARRILRYQLAKEIPAALRKSNRDLFGGVFPPPGADIPFDPDNLPEAPAPLKSLKGKAEDLNLCIVGAGVAGLYIAMILDDLAIPGLSYDILESSDRVGGRLFTYRFSDSPTHTHDYYDVGAMRYPEIPIMDRVFKLFEITGVQKGVYHMDGVNIPSLYNDILKVGPPEGSDPFKISEANGGPVQDSIVEKGASAILNEVFGPYIEELKKDFDAGFLHLMEKDNYSTREYIRSIPEYSDFYTVEYLETANSGTGLYNQAFSESVIDAFDFEAENWCYIEGGSSDLINRMVQSIKVAPTTGTRVKAIALERDPGETPDHPIWPPSPNKSKMLVTAEGESQPRQYDTVFNTASLACAQRMDLSQAELHPVVKAALRALHYDASSKVAIKFSSSWWRQNCNITNGGSASTDMPLRVCVYPSYSLSDPPSASAVLLCSYTWSQDAQRVASMVKDSSPTGENELKDMLLYELARLHHESMGLSVKDAYSFLSSSYVTHHAFDWYHDPNVSGAFALFGPGQFSHYYPHLTRPASDGKLHFVGEAASAHHAWVVGALDSAYRAVLHFLTRFGMGEYIEKLEQNWGEVGEIEKGIKGTTHLQVALGTLRPKEQVVVN